MARLVIVEKLLGEAARGQEAAAAATVLDRGGVLMAHKRDFLSRRDLSGAEIERILDHASRLERAFRAGEVPQTLKGEAVALWFPDTGFRNLVAFDLGIRRMGGDAIRIPGELGQRETTEDMAVYLSNWFNATIVRAPSYAAVQQLAGASRVPVINARTHHNHPCEVLGDLAYARKVRGVLAGLTVVFVGRQPPTSATAGSRQPRSSQYG